MDNRKATSNPNPRETANIFSVLTFAWTYNLFKTGYKKILNIDDLYDPVNNDRSDILGDRLEKQWFAELERAKKKKRKPNFLWAILRANAPSLALQGCYQFAIDLIFRVVTPMLLGALLQHFKPKPTITYETALLYATGIMVIYVMNTIAQNQAIHLSYHTGGRVRIGVCSVVYRKALRLSKTALGETAPGKIVNLVSNDVNRFELVMTFLHYMWSAPMLTIVVVGVLYSEVGWSALVGIFIIFIVVPFQGYLGKLSSKYRLEIALKTDERVRLMDEIISGVQVIKMYAWEKPFCALIELVRHLELKVVRKSSYVRAIFMTFFLFTARMALYGTLMAMMLRGQKLSADRVFMYMTYFNLISLTMSYFFVRGISEIAECFASIGRLENFLMLEEFDLGDSNAKKIDLNDALKFKDNFKDNMIIRVNDSLENGCFKLNGMEFPVIEDEKMNTKNWAVKLNHVTAKWNLHSIDTTLDDINLEVNKGKLYIAIGMVGAGKSSLISTILGELKLLQGTTDIKGSISYADQEAWVFGATVRQNILFGQEFDRKRYAKVIEVCALQKDFQQFPDGDQTIVGERGSSLSGGQKARVNLARAVYREADIYLLDDPLSAVDAHVGKHLFEECIQKYLARKTRILATHQLQYIKGADAILFLDQGKMYKFDEYHELLRAYPEYNSLIAEEKKEIIVYSNTGRRFSSTSIKSSITDTGSSICEEDNEEQNNKQRHGFYEGTSRGTVKGNLLVNYINSGGSSFGIFILIILLMATQLSVMLYDFFIPVLVNTEESRNYYIHLHENNSLLTDNNLVKTNKSSAYYKQEDILPKDHYVYIYTTVTLSIFFIAIIRSFSFYNMCLSASQRLHDLVFGALIRSTMQFFNTNPSGRILNRFSKDLGAVDEMLPKTLLDATQAILTIVGAIIVTCIVNYYFLIPTAIIGGLFFIFRKIYIKSSKNIKRLEGMSRSPVFTHLSATLNGITTIRAYKAETILKKEFDKLQDTHTSTWYMFISTSVAFSFVLDVCSLVFVGIVTFSFLLFEANFSSGEVGLAITQMMSLMGMLQWGIRQSAEVTNQLMSVERVLEYSQLPCEPNLRDKGIVKKTKKEFEKAQKKDSQLIEIPKNWPSKGLVQFKNMSMRYSNGDPPVLKNLTFTIQPSEKIGVVGRTGAGKSSLISALFRLTPVEGVIEIDGIDTGTIALEDLRKNMSIIPQDPTLFSGALRRNLDPFNEFSDELLWKVLEEVELKDSIKLTGNGLDHRVMDRGSNYSTGQRQLICLARAILRNNRILMLDEATANVDPQTDTLIQRTIRTKFARCTVLTVAHRLNTIMDSDKVLVMDKGCITEFDHPHILLKNEQGTFSLLVKETGQAMYEQLCKVASDAYYDKERITQ